MSKIKMLVELVPSGSSEGVCPMPLSSFLLVCQQYVAFLALQKYHPGLHLDPHMVFSLSAYLYLNFSFL